MDSYESGELERLHDRVSKDSELHQSWSDAGEFSASEDSEPAPTLEFSNASEEYFEIMEEWTKWWPPASGWYNWYSDKQTMLYRRWSTFDLALGNWVLGFVEPLKQQLEAARFCEHTVIDPTPHYRFLRLRCTRDVLRPNLGLNQEGLGDRAGSVAQDSPVKLPVMVFQVATRETLDTARSDMWRHLWLSDRCQVGIIFIVNSFYGQFSQPFKLSMEIWSCQPTDLEYPYPLDDCPLPTSQIPFGRPSNKNESHAERKLADSSQPVDLEPVLERNADGLLTFRPTEDEAAIVMRHREEI
ncbi:unnamed protein product [Rhizoctonia solani]|uniref:Uncharacterized protein n=1 Tax=Rhizoctonia solani TaxID=456999 RepID=A0A8H3HFW1_9AGAM|nr:unnamed protein product [Rhizoctonia solani]